MAHRMRSCWRPIILLRLGLAALGILIVAATGATAWSVSGDRAGLGPGKTLLIAAGGGLLLAGFALRMSVARRWARRVAAARATLVLVGLMVGLLVAESGLRLLSVTEWSRAPLDSGPAASERRATADFDQYADARLEYRLPPYALGHDAKGFRNDAIPDLADIVAIGDSQTWGFNAARSAAWPQVLAKLSKRSVYNMALGGYGPVQYWMLTEEALKLSPQIVVVGVFFGNDLWDAYHMAYRNELYAQFRTPKAEDDLSVDTVIRRVNPIRDEEMRFIDEFLRQSRRSHTSQVNWSTWRDWLTKRSAIFQLLKERGWLSEEEGLYQASRAWALTYPDHGSVFEQGRVRTVLTPGYRAMVVDLDEPRIAEGLRITKETLRGIRDMTESANARVLVLLIPTKEMVYGEIMKVQQGQLSQAHARLTEMESRVRAELVSFCKASDIECADSLPILVEAVQRNEPVFPSTTDSHLNAYGYSLLARTAADVLIKKGW